LILLGLATIRQKRLFAKKKGKKLLFAIKNLKKSPMENKTTHEMFEAERGGKLLIFDN
jgi:hypothetical protein